MGVIATRTERVVLDLDASSFTTGMARAAAAATLLHQELNGLNTNLQGFGGDAADQTGHLGDEMERLSSSTAEVNPNVVTADRNIARLGNTADHSGNSINQLSGRLSLLADAAIVLGPGLVPLGSQGARGIAGLAAATLGLATAAGTAVVAFQGIGDAAKAVNEYELDPTVANLEKVQEAFEKLGPDAQTFVLKFQELRPVLTEIKRQAEAGLFPGLTQAIDDVDQLAGAIGRIFKASGSAAGLTFADNLDSLQSSRWRPFMRFVEEEAPSAIFSLNRIMGDLAHGASELFMALDPSNDSFLQWLENVADGFDRWARSSEGRNDIQAFMDYTRQNGPAVAAFFSSLVDATTQVVKAAAPLGGPTLTILTKVLEVVAKIAESDLGTPFLTGLVALRTYSRMLAVVQSQQARLATTPIGGASAAGGATFGAGVMGPPTSAQAAASAAAQRAQRLSYARMGTQGAAAVGAMALASSGLADDMDMANTASLTLMGTMLAPGWGTAAGLVGGALLDVAQANDEFEAALGSAQDSVDRADFSGYAKQLEDVTSKREEFASDVNNFSWDEALLPVRGLGDLKNAVEGIFGDSDVDEMNQEQEKLAASAVNAAKAVGELGRAFGMNVGKIDGSKRSTEQLLHVVDKMQPAMDRLGITTEDLATARALQNSSLGKMSGLTPYDDLIVQLEIVNQKIRESISLQDTFTNSLQRAQEFLSRNGAIDAANAAFLNLKKSVKDNGTAFDKMSEKGLANRAALRDLGGAIGTAAEQLHGLARTKFLDEMRGKFRDAAKALDLPIDQTKRWMRELGLLERKPVKPHVGLDTNGFDERAARVQRGMTEMNRAKAEPEADLDTTPFDGKKRKVQQDINVLDAFNPTPTVDLFAGQFFSVANDVRSQLANLNGSTATTYIKTVRLGGDAVPGARGGSYASGGFTGLGGKYEVAGLVHRNEIVLPQEIVKRDWGMLSSRYGHLPGFADGGLVGGLSYRGDAATDDSDETKKHREETKKDREETEKHRKAMARHRAEVEKTEKALQKERDQRQNMLSYRSEVGASLAGDLTGGGLAQFDTGLAANRNDARAMLRALREARKKGLSGPLMDLIAASGDLSLAQSFADLSRAAITRRERQYGATVRSQNQLGGFAVSEKFGESLAHNAATIDRLEKQLKKLRHDVREGARQGTREGAGKGKRDRDREGHHRTRAGR